MKRTLRLAVLAAACAACVSVEPAPPPRGALKPGQRLVVIVYQSPGPWIVADADTKAEAAAKISPLGFLVQGLQDGHTLAVSKDLQQYLPRPPYGQELIESLLPPLRAALSTATVQTAREAGLDPAQLREWNKSEDQLDWRRRYYAPEPGRAPRDYARVLSLDDALILDMNLSFGTETTEAGAVVPALAAAARVYRGDTARLLWEHEETMLDKSGGAPATPVSTSTTSKLPPPPGTTLAEFKVNPSDLTNRLEKLAPQLGQAVAGKFAEAFGLSPSTSALVAASTAAPKGLRPPSFFMALSSGAPAGVAASSAPAAEATSPAPTPRQNGLPASFFTEYSSGTPLGSEIKR